MPEIALIPLLKPLKIGGDSVNIDVLLKREYDDVGEASAEIPAMVEWVNNHRADYSAECVLAKQEIKEAEAAVFFELKGGAFMEQFPTIKVTDKAVEHAIALDKRVQDAYRRYVVLKKWTSRLAGTGEALSAKLDLVRSVEATRRSVMSESEDPQ